MTNRPKAIGTAGETAVARYLAANGFPHAERRALRGLKDAGDIAGCPGLCWSVKAGEAAKNASDADVDRWLSELSTQRGHAGADIGVLVLARRGYGAQRAGSWWAITSAPDLFHVHGGPTYGLLGAYWTADIPVRLHLAHMVRLLRLGGWGESLQGVDPLEVTP